MASNYIRLTAKELLSLGLTSARLIFGECDSRFHIFMNADLSDANMKNAIVKGGDFHEASLKYADLSGADFSDTNLEGADLRGTVFTRTNLRDASIYRTIPEEPDLHEALYLPSSKPRKVPILASGGGGGGTGYGDPPAAESTAVKVTVYYATDRKPELQSDRRRFYGPFDTEDLSYGTCEVSVPRDKPIGQIPRPSVWKLEFRENLKKHVVLLGSRTMNRAEFYASMSSSEKSALVFVHGYKVSFEDAARRTAQLAYDLSFKGVPTFYSWASKASLRDYPADLASNERTWPRLAACLSDISQLGHFEKIHVISHSMGSRAICHSAQRVFDQQKPDTPLFKNFIFAAPDVEVSVFRDTLSHIASLAARFTLYFSPKDFALRVSSRFNDSPRTGAVGVFANGLDTIDASAIIGDILGHSHLGERDVVSDIYELLTGDRPAKDRFGLLPLHNAGLQYFQLRP